MQKFVKRKDMNDGSHQIHKFFWQLSRSDLNSWLQSWGHLGQCFPSSIWRSSCLLHVQWPGESFQTCPVERIQHYLGYFRGDVAENFVVLTFAASELGFGLIESYTPFVSKTHFETSKNVQLFKSAFSTYLHDVDFVLPEYPSHTDLCARIVPEIAFHFL